MNPICLLEGNTLVTRLSMAEADPQEFPLTCSIVAYGGSDP